MEPRFGRDIERLAERETHVDLVQHATSLLGGIGH
jgi:hypothetical protein